MNRLTRMNAHLLCSVSLLAATVTAQDFILYKFDDGCSSEAINFASGPAAFPGNGVLEWNTGGSPLASGRFRDALAGGNTATRQYCRVRTGWNPGRQPLLGDMTLAFWMRQRSPVTTLTYLSGTTLLGGTRMFTGGTAGRGLYMLGVVTGGGNGGAATDLLLPSRLADIQTLAAAGWTHVALVVDAAAATAEWFVDGVSVLRLTGVGPTRIVSNGEYMVGFQGTTNASNYDVDEFLLSRRAYTGTEVMVLAMTPRAGDGPYASGVAACGTARLRSQGGAPTVGNAGYGLELDSPATGQFFLVMGYERCRLFGTWPLPLELVPGCWLVTDVVSVRGGTITGMPVLVPLRVPPMASYLDLRVFGQFAVFEGTGGLHFSNGLAIAVGR